MEGTVIRDFLEGQIWMQMEFSCQRLKNTKLRRMCVADTEVKHAVKPNQSHKHQASKRNDPAYLPGLSNAGSNRSGRLVAPITKTSALA